MLEAVNKTLKYRLTENRNTVHPCIPIINEIDSEHMKSYKPRRPVHNLIAEFSKNTGPINPWLLTSMKFQSKTFCDYQHNFISFNIQAYINGINNSTSINTKTNPRRIPHIIIWGINYFRSNTACIHSEVLNPICLNQFIN